MTILQRQPLDANIVHNAQKLLLKQFLKVGSLQSTHLYQVNKFSQTDGIWIHHTGTFHWLLQQQPNVPNQVEYVWWIVSGQEGSPEARKFESIRSMAIVGQAQLWLMNCVHFQQQRGDKDYGLFAIAYAMEVVQYAYLSWLWFSSGRLSAKSNVKTPGCMLRESCDHFQKQTSCKQPWNTLWALLQLVSFQLRRIEFKEKDGYCFFGL